MIVWDFKHCKCNLCDAEFGSISDGITHVMNVHGVRDRVSARLCLTEVKKDVKEVF